MSGKNRVFALAVATAATIGLGAPAAGAAVLGGGGNGNGSLANVSNNQVTGQLCNDYVAVNVLGGQVPLSSIAAALSALSSGDTTATQNSSCGQVAFQNNDPAADPATSTSQASGQSGSQASDPSGSQAGDPSWHRSGNGNHSLLNVSNNQVTGQACNDTVAVNVLGIQVPGNSLSGAAGLLSSGDTTSNQNSSCGQLVGQNN
jgi:hypothetical protein